MLDHSEYFFFADGFVHIHIEFWLRTRVLADFIIARVDSDIDANDLTNKIYMAHKSNIIRFSLFVFSRRIHGIKYM